MELNVAFGAEGARLDYTRPTNGICCNVTRRLPLCHVNERVRNGEGREEGEGVSLGDRFDLRTGKIFSAVKWCKLFSSFLSFKYSLNVNGKCTSEHIVGKKKTCNLYRFICESGKKINARIGIIFL